MGLRPAWGSPGVAGDALGPSSTWHDADAADAVLLLSAPHPSPCIGNDNNDNDDKNANNKNNDNNNDDNDDNNDTDDEM